MAAVSSAVPSPTAPTAAVAEAPTAEEQPVLTFSHSRGTGHCKVGRVSRTTPRLLADTSVATTLICSNSDGRIKCAAAAAAVAADGVVGGIVLLARAWRSSVVLPGRAAGAAAAVVVARARGRRRTPAQATARRASSPGPAAPAP
jgi:hypothetical protein